MNEYNEGEKEVKMSVISDKKSVVFVEEMAISLKEENGNKGNENQNKVPNEDSKEEPKQEGRFEGNQVYLDDI